MVSPEALAEYQAYQNQSGFYPAQDFSVLRMSGKDRLSFLHNFCTADIKSLAPGNLTEAFVLDPKGKTLFFILVLAAEENLLIAIPDNQREALQNHLERYVIVEDVQITSSDEDHLVLASWEFPGSAKCHVNENTWLGVLNDGSAFANWKVDGKTELSADTWQMIRVENGFPTSGIDVTEDCLAQEFERDATAISYTKGCYLGQETVARLDALGHTNRAFRVARCKNEELPDLQADLKLEDKSVGRVTSTAWSPKLQSHLVLAMIKKPSHQFGTVLTWGDQAVTPCDIQTSS